MKKILCVLMVCILAMMGAAFAETEISVQGKAMLIVPADIASISIGIQTIDESAANAQAATNEKIASVREACLALGISEDDLITDCIRVNNTDYYYSIDTSYDSDSTKHYDASTTITVRVQDMELAGKVIDTAIEAGADSVYGANFFISDASAYNDDLLKAAVADARAKAEIFAADMGMSITGVKLVNELYSESYEIGAGGFVDHKAVEGNDSTQVGTTNVQLSETISVTFIAE